jgi:GR25 family glycosyltransferase involved in LPS biosynthesis
MSFTNSIVDKVYVINLEKDKEKLQSIGRQLDSQNIKFERFDAILGKDIKDNSKFTDFCFNNCTNGIKGCALSHNTLWNKNDYENIMIFEDDAILSKTFDTDLLLLWKDIPKDFDIIYLGSLFYCGDKSLYTKTAITIRNLKNDMITPNVYAVDGCAGLHGYIISKKFARKLVNEKISFHIDDNLIGWIKKYNLKAYALQPSLVIQNLNNSNLSSDYPKILNSFLSKIIVSEKHDNVGLNWLLNESFFKIGSINLCALMFILLFLSFLIPLKYYFSVYVWLFIELVVSRDIPNTLFYGTLLSLPFFIKYYY